MGGEAPVELNGPTAVDGQAGRMRCTDAALLNNTVLRASSSQVGRSGCRPWVRLRFQTS